MQYLLHSRSVMGVKQGGILSPVLFNIYKDKLSIALNDTAIGGNIGGQLLNVMPVRSLRQHFIHPPLIRTAYAECTPLYQLINLYNSLREDKDDIILSNVELKIDSFCTFSYKVSRII